MHTRSENRKPICSFLNLVVVHIKFLEFLSSLIGIVVAGIILGNTGAEFAEQDSVCLIDADVEMQIFVKSLTGKTLAVNAQAGETVNNVKALIQEREGIAAAVQRLSFAGKTLSSETLLATIPAMATLDLNIDLLGGAKKRKKKTYTTPKKIKHKKRKVKLAVLKFYQVDNNGKITRLRRECPSETCGAGIFMAWHHDRQYCGRCGLTYVFKKEGETA
ncbi:ribosomal protein S27a-domain-containing protein [Gamsiella multidivaricata]|uniref:ribosomal protein S27a-domain-containing protein n=1 Tax=Gamsiella multidivaricata TaxID=101098 RepID=UPI00221EF8F9|nr:ribosomal protein S27a-domain-containing protein [Gamsiella multidivaricata]KAI7823364.1 ribosomal protein S27a-domain-containing protein [Gamsiella multidivaricata]